MTGVEDIKNDARASHEHRFRDRNVSIVEAIYNVSSGKITGVKSGGVPFGGLVGTGNTDRVRISVVAHTPEKCTINISSEQYTIFVLMFSGPGGEKGNTSSLAFVVTPSPETEERQIRALVFSDTK